MTNLLAIGLSLLLSATIISVFCTTVKVFIWVSYVVGRTLLALKGITWELKDYEHIDDVTA